MAWPIRSILADQSNATVIMGEVAQVDVTARHIVASEGLTFPFDYLVIATGVTTSYFNHPEWEKYAPGLKTIEEATRIRGHILACFERAERSDDEALRQKLMTFTVVGGGATGVELAGSITDIATNVLVGDSGVSGRRPPRSC